jgi:hypothetical protein
LGQASRLDRDFNFYPFVFSIDFFILNLGIVFVVFLALQEGGEGNVKQSDKVEPSTLALAVWIVAAATDIVFWLS